MIFFFLNSKIALKIIGKIVNIYFASDKLKHLHTSPLFLFGVEWTVAAAAAAAVADMVKCKCSLLASLCNIFGKYLCVAGVWSWRAMNVASVELLRA